MKTLERIENLTQPQKVKLGAGILAAAFILSILNGSLQSGLVNAKKEYAFDRELTKNGSEYRQRYEQTLLQSQRPASVRMAQNDWIRSMQERIRTHNLLLRELTPVNQDGGELALVLEGPTANMVSFLQELAFNNDWVSVSHFKMSRQADKDVVEAELQLTQR